MMDKKWESEKKKQMIGKKSCEFQFPCELGWIKPCEFQIPTFTRKSIESKRPKTQSIGTRHWNRCCKEQKIEKLYLIIRNLKSTSKFSDKCLKKQDDGKEMREKKKS